MAAVMSGAGAWEWKAEVQTRSKPVVGAGVSFHRHVSSITVSLLQSSPVLTQRVLSAALSPEGRLATDRSGTYSLRVCGALASFSLGACHCTGLCRSVGYARRRSTFVKPDKG